MVCKKSLYCWKNGPCASDQTRKQIWEDNIRFRTSLRDLNQSDHYWSFQIYKNRCLCIEEDLVQNRPLSRKYRSASLQRLHDIDCASVTHDCNGLKFRNCYVHCPNHDNFKSLETRTATPIPPSLTRKDPALSSVKYPLRALHKPEDIKSEFCHRYINTLTNPKLKPSIKTKFLSQTNLNSLNDSKNSLNKKVLHSSCEDISHSKPHHKSKLEVGKGVSNKSQELKKVEEPICKTVDCEVQTDLLKPMKPKESRPVLKFPNQEKLNELSPISRTTRKMLLENKKVPFLTYGCNNNNLNIGSKRTHNVLASKFEVYPSALTAKQHKRDSIMKYLQCEKEVQKQCLPKELQRRINHSSLWSLDTANKENKSHQKKHNKYLLPLMNKPIKKITVSSSLCEPGSYRTYRKPQVYFY